MQYIYSILPLEDKKMGTSPNFLNKSIKSFGGIAQKLSRNPLGIIALFIVLIYGIACLTFGFSKNLPHSAVSLFVAFILIYPLIVLWVFYNLVTKHHTKLYAPQDFPIPEDFRKCAYGDNSRILTKKEIIAAPAVSFETSSTVDVGEGINVEIETPRVEDKGEKK